MYLIRNWQACDFYALQDLYAEMNLSTTISIYASLELYQSADPSRFIYKAICYLDQVCGLIQAEKKNANQVEIGFWIQSAYRNQHILSNVLEVFCDMVVKQFHVHAIYARVETSNMTSRHVLLQHHFHIKCTYQNDIIVYQRKYAYEKE